jgi:hypothetical protein
MFAGIQKRLTERRTVWKTLVGNLGQGPIEEAVQSGRTTLEMAGERHLRVVSNGVSE